MHKDFDRWNKLKKKVHVRQEEVRFHVREIWWCALGANIGSEQDGMTKTFERPVVVIKNFNGRVLWIVPLTRTYKAHNPYYYHLDSDDKGMSVALVTQLRLISSKRLIRKIRMLDKSRFHELLLWIRDLLKNELLDES